MPPPTTYSQVLLQEEFSQSGGAWDYGGELGSFKAQGGSLRTRAVRGVVRRRLVRVPHDSVTIDVDVTRRSDTRICVLCRGSSSGAAYYRLCTSAGYDEIKRETLEGAIAQAWFAAPPAAAERVTSHVHAECIGSKLRLYVDGTPRIEGESESLDRGDKVGLAIFGGETGAEAEFDNFVVRAR